jgi:hypothetical protein
MWSLPGVHALILNTVMSLSLDSALQIPLVPYTPPHASTVMRLNLSRVMCKTLSSPSWSQGMRS